jgi:folate-binding protein YgfZ
VASPIANPLLHLHQQAEAEFQPYAELEIVSTFGEPQAEYAAVRKAAGMIDLPQRGIIELTGPDRLAFLNNLLTNQTWDKQAGSGLLPGQGVYAFLLVAKTGKILVDLNVLELTDRTLLELDARFVPTVADVLEKYRFAEKVTISPRLNEFHEIAVHGSGSMRVLAEALDQRVELETPMSSMESRLYGSNVYIWRDDPCGVAGLHLILTTSDAAAVWMQLLTRFGVGEVGKRPLRPIGWAAFNSARIEAGRALFGIDFDDSVLPAETGKLALARAVSFTKGCYPGQEVVARMHARQQLARQIVGIRMENDALPIAGAQVLDRDGAVVGGITSSTPSPLLGNVAICLAMVKRPYFATGTTLTVPAEGKLHFGVVTDAPFVAV